MKQAAHMGKMSRKARMRESHGFLVDGISKDEGVRGVVQQRALGWWVTQYRVRCLAISFVPANLLPQPCAQSMREVTGWDVRYSYFPRADLPVYSDVLLLTALGEVMLEVLLWLCCPCFMSPPFLSGVFLYLVSWQGSSRPWPVLAAYTSSLVEPL